MKWFWIWLAALSPLVCVAAIGPERNAAVSIDDTTQIRVLLDEPSYPKTVGWQRPDVWMTTATSRRKIEQKKITLETHGTKIRIKWGKNQWHESESFVLGSEPGDAEIFEYDGRHYRGTLKLIRTRDTTLVINQVPLQAYLEGTLGSEMSPAWEMEALKAQAVAARSYAMHMMLFPKHALYDLQNSTRDQVYRGFDGESSRVRFAVQKTRGVFLSDKKDPSKAHYHSRCGGTTETALTVWKKEAPAGKDRVDCPYCRKNPYTWTASWDRSDLIRKLKILIPLGGTFRIRTAAKTPSGRIASLQIESEGKTQTLSSDLFRSRLGYEAIKSALFHWKTDQDSIHFEGVGAGHGVGMCQWGARYFAKQGNDFRRILSHYYPGLSLHDKMGAITVSKN